MTVALVQRLLDLTEAPTMTMALNRVAQYVALRTWATIISCFPIELNLRTARWMGWIWWTAMKRHRDRALDNLRPALGDRYTDTQLRRIARRSFQHFAEVYLVEAVMTPRIVNEWSWARYVELEQLGPALRELLTGHGAILIAGHFGNFELLGFTICRLGIPLTAVMRPVDNPLINRYLEAARAAGGLSLVHKKGVSAIVGDVLDRGEPVAFIADQDAGRKGMFVDFFGRQASTYKSIGLLAMAKRVPIIVGYAARVGRGFHYRIGVQRIIHPDEWDTQDDPLVWITATFTAALEAAIRRWPEQYLWVHRRWKHRPKAERPRTRQDPAMTQRDADGGSPKSATDSLVS